MQAVRKSGLTASALADKNLFMSAAAVRSDVVSLDEYRRARGAVRGPAEPTRVPAPAYQPVPTAVWVYWVPVWIW
jgi:hypothetical protein